MKTNIGFSEIEDYLLGKLSPDEAHNVKEAVRNDSELAKLKSEIESGLENAKRINDLSISKASSQALYNRIKRMTKRPEVRAGQVWQIESIGKVLVTELSKDKKICRFIPLTDDTLFAYSSDVKFTEKDISFLPLVAHTHLASVTKTGNLLLYFGNISKEITKAIKAFDKGVKCKLPKGVIAGADEVYPEYEIWEEFIRVKLDKLYGEALKVGTNEKATSLIAAIPEKANILLNTIIEKLAVIPAIAEPIQVYNLAAKSSTNPKEEVYSSDNLIIEFEDLSDALGINFIFGEKKADKLKSIKIINKKAILYEAERVKVINQTTKISINDKNVLDKMKSSVLTFKLVDATESLIEVKLRIK